MNIHWLWPSAVVVSFILTWLSKRLAEKHRLLDLPNERSSHHGPVPRGGGVAIAVTFMAGMSVAAVAGVSDAGLLTVVIGGGGLVAMVGLIDDYRDVSAALRLMSHTIAAVWALYWLGGIPGELLPGVPAVLTNVLGVVCVVWLVNLFNFMDGIDGIASIETMTVCVGGIVLYACSVAGSTAWVSPAMLLASVAGFLFWNYPPARIFLGDAGSGLLGFMMAVFCIQAAQIEPLVFWGWLILLGVFIVDTAVTLVRRMVRRERPYEAHRNHAYQFASRKLDGHAPVSLAVGAINLFWLLPIAVLTVTERVAPVLAVPIAYAPLLWLAFHYKAGAPELQDA